MLFAKHYTQLNCNMKLRFCYCHYCFDTYTCIYLC